jgi:hypothetical protein
MKKMLLALLQAIFIVLRDPNDSVRQCPLALSRVLVGHQAILLGLELDTRSLTLSITDDYRHSIIKMIDISCHKY